MNGERIAVVGAFDPGLGPGHWSAAIGALILNPAQIYDVQVPPGRDDVAEWIADPETPGQVRERLERMILETLGALWGQVRVIHSDHQTERRAPWTADQVSITLAGGLVWPPANVRWIRAEPDRTLIDESLPNGAAWRDPAPARPNLTPPEPPEEP